MKNRARIEPQISSDDIASNDADVFRDVLMEAPSKRTKAKEMPVAKKEKLETPKRGYTKTLPEQQPLARKKIVPNRVDVKKEKKGYLILFRSFSLCVLVIFLVLGIYWLSEPVSKALDRPIKSVVVEGDFYFMPKERATDLIGNEIDDDFLQIDLMRIKKAVLNDPWVESVTLTRQWPDTLVVKITEQKPIARWGEGFLNHRGDIIAEAEDARLKNLPYLSGNEVDAVEILQQYQDFSQLLRSRGLDIIALSCDDKKSWRLTLNNNIEIAIGRDQVMEKMQRFITVYDVQLKDLWADVKSVDVRYSNGVAVRWAAGSVAAKKYLEAPVKAG
jgi:cell division protein FtsQ